MDIPEGFNPHDGNSCPFDKLSTAVETFWGDGVILRVKPAIGFVVGPENWAWQHEMIALHDRIIAYRVVDEGTQDEQ